MDLFCVISKLMQLTVYTIATGYDEQTLSLHTCASRAINMQILSHINQWQYLHHMHTPQGPIRPHCMIHG